MTKAAQHFGKDLQVFIRREDTVQYIAALDQTVSDTDCHVIQAFRGGKTPGTWGHPKLAVFFARWLDVKFAVWCDMVIDDLLHGKAEVTITKPEESAVLGQLHPKGPHVTEKGCPLLSVPLMNLVFPMRVSVEFQVAPFAAVPLVIVVLPNVWLF